MNIEFIKEAVIRAEGYAEGFRAGYQLCAQKIANEMAKENEIKENQSKEKDNGN